MDDNPGDFRPPSTPPPPPPPPPPSGQPWQGGYQNYQGSQGYGQSPYSGYGTGQLDHPRTVPAFILSLLGVLICAPLAIVGLVFGRQAQRDMQAAPGRYSNEGLAKAAVVIGWIGIAFMILGVIFFLLFFVGMIGAGFSA